MSLFIEIAGVKLCLEGEDFLGRLSPFERILLAPFISQKIFSGKSSLVYVRHILDNNALSYKYKINSKIVASIGSSFFYNNRNSESGRFLTDFIGTGLAHYLADNKNNYNNMIVGKRTIVFYDEGRQCYSLIYGKTDNHRTYYLNGLKLLLRMILNIRQKGVIYHAASIEQDGSGYIFVGPNGSGKSTTVKLLNPERVLSDDMAVIVKDRGKGLYKIYPTPWWNYNDNIAITRPQFPSKLKAIFFIQKSKKNSLSRMAYKEALATLIYRDNGAFHQIGFFDNKKGIEKNYLFAQELVKDIPVFRLYINKGHCFKKEFYKLLEDNI